MNLESIDACQTLGGFEYRVFDNGLVALVEPNPHSDLAALMVAVNAGSADDDPSAIGTAHFLEHMAFKSNPVHTKEQLAQEMEFAGIERSPATSPTAIRFKFTLVPESLSVAVRLAHESYTNTTYDPKEFENEKKPIEGEINGNEKNSKVRYTKHHLYPAVYAGTPFANLITGTVEQAKALTLDDLIRFKQTHFRPRKTLIVATGSVDPSTFFSEIEKTFGQLPSGDSPISFYTWDFKSRTLYIEEDALKGAPSDKDLAAAFLAFQVSPYGHQDEAGLSFMQTLLRDGFSSLLVDRLRAQRGIGYTPSSGFMSYRRNASVALGVPPEFHPSRIEEAIEVIQGVVDDMKKGRLDPSFFDGKKRHYSLIHRKSLQDPLTRAQAWTNQIFEGGHYDFRTLPSVIAQFSQGAFTDLSQRNFSTEPLIVIASAPGYQNRHRPSS